MQLFLISSAFLSKIFCKCCNHFKYDSHLDVRIEYEYFKLEDGNWPEEFFPKDKIKSFKDFQKYWNPKALGEVFVAPIGALIFDCYFGRTSKNAMRGIGKYLAVNHRDIELATGSYDTFFERGMTRLERQIMKESSIKFNY
jgi:hypothetical protein